MKTRFILLFFVVLLVSLGSRSVVHATDVTLQWNAETDPNVVGYKLYYKADTAGAPYNGTGALEGASPVNVASLTSTTLSGLDPSHAYYFTVTAYDAAGNESPYASTVSIPESVPPTASITSPLANASLSGVVTVSATASDNVGVTKVELYVDGALAATDTASPYTFSWDTTKVASGSHSLMVKAYDAAGNVGDSATVSVLIGNDLVPPTVSVSSPASGAVVGGSSSVAIAAADNVGLSKVELYINGVIYGVYTTAPYTFTWNTLSYANGLYTLYAKAYDTSGNVTQSASVSVTVSNDTTAPTVSLTAPAANATVSGTVSVAATAADNVGVSKVELYVNSVLQATDTASPYTFSWNTTALANGSYTLTAKAYDAAGNVTQSAGVPVTVSNDKTAPTVSLTTPTANATVSSTVSVAATAADNVGVTKVELYVNNVLQATDTASPYTFSWNTTALANGSYTLTAKAYDAAGNVTQSAGVPVTVSNDKTAPTVSLTAPAANATVSGTVSVAATAADNVGVSKVELYVNNVLQATDTASPYTFSWNTAALATGSYTLTAKAYDAAGNVGQSSAVTVSVNNSDTTAPTVSLTSPTANATVSGTVSVAATATDNIGVAKVEFYVNNVLQATDTAAPYTFSWNTSALSFGIYTLSAKAYDAAGNVSQTASITVTVNNLVLDTTAPTVSLTAPAANATVSGTVSVTASASDNISVAKVEFYVNNVLQVTDTASPYSFSWNTSALASGSYTLTAKAYDAAGNVTQSAGVPVTVKNDTTAPTVSLTAPTANATVSGTVSVAATATDNVGVTKVEFYVNNVLKATDTAGPYTYSWDTTAVANGSYTLTVKAYDAAGNVGQSSAITVTVGNVVRVKGDVDGDGAITVKDVLAVLKAVSDPTLVTPTLLKYGDVAPLDTVTGQPVGDGKINVSDALLLLQYVVGSVTW